MRFKLSSYLLFFTGYEFFSKIKMKSIFIKILIKKYLTTENIHKHEVYVELKYEVSCSVYSVRILQ